MMRSSSVLLNSYRKFVAHESLKILLNFHGFWTFLLCLGTFISSAEQAYVHLTLEYVILYHSSTWISPVHSGIYILNSCALEIPRSFFSRRINVSLG